jgi:hypothetical protein
MLHLTGAIQRVRESLKRPPDGKSGNASSRAERYHDWGFRPRRDRASALVHPPLASAQDVTLIVGPVFAALAAGAAWVAAIQALRVGRAADQPFLCLQVTVNSDRCYGGVVINAGDGIARGVGFVISDGTSIIAGPLRHGFLRPGEAIQVLSSLPRTTNGPVVGFVNCRDRFGMPHDWTSDEQHETRGRRSLRSGFRRCPIYGPLVHRLRTYFPENPAPDALVQVPVTEVVDPH